MTRSTDDEVARFARKVILNVALVVASPFLMLAFLFFLLERPAVWSLVPLAIALLLYAAALVVWLVVRERLRAAAQAVEVFTADEFTRRPE